MADYSYTAGNVSLVSGIAVTGKLAEACTAGNVLYYNSTEQQWYLAGHNAPAADRYGVALVSGSAEQTIAICDQVGAVVDYGDFVLDEGEIVVASSNADGAIAPYADLNVPSGDSLLLVGFATTTRFLSLLLNRTGATAMPTRTGSAAITLTSITVSSAGTVVMEGSASIAVGAITVSGTGTVA